MTLAELNGLPPDAAAERLRACCGSSRWVRAMLDQRPFASVEELLAAAAEVWSRTTPEDREEAFGHHPRIGQGRAPTAVSRAAAAWSAGEQRGVAGADEVTRRAMADGNAAYQRRFGRVYIVCATGKSAADLLADLRARLANHPDRERTVAAAEQEKITALRLQKLIQEPA